MSTAQLMEKEFEKTLCEELAERGWLYENDGKPSGWDTGLAMVPEDVLYWLSTQYPDEYEKAVPANLENGARKNAEQKLLEHITRELRKATRLDPNTGNPVGGLLGVLKTGFKYVRRGGNTAQFGKMMEFPPGQRTVARCR